MRHRLRTGGQWAAIRRSGEEIRSILSSTWHPCCSGRARSGWRRPQIFWGVVRSGQADVPAACNAAPVWFATISPLARCSIASVMLPPDGGDRQPDQHGLQHSLRYAFVGVGRQGKDVQRLQPRHDYSRLPGMVTRCCSPSWTICCWSASCCRPWPTMTMRCAARSAGTAKAFSR